MASRMVAESHEYLAQGGIVSRNARWLTIAVVTAVHSLKRRTRHAMTAIGRFLPVARRPKIPKKRTLSVR